MATSELSDTVEVWKLRKYSLKCCVGGTIGLLEKKSKKREVDADDKMGLTNFDFLLPPLHLHCTVFIFTQQPIKNFETI